MYEESLKHYLLSLEYAELLNDINELQRFISCCFLKCGEIDNCLFYFDKSLHTATSNLQKFECYKELGKCYKENVYLLFKYN